jgi:hypothetical protein
MFRFSPKYFGKVIPPVSGRKSKTWIQETRLQQRRAGRSTNLGDIPQQDPHGVKERPKHEVPDKFIESGAGYDDRAEQNHADRSNQ